MAKYKIEVKRSAAKEIEKLEGRDLKAVLKRIDGLAEDPRAKDSKKLTNEEKYRVRCGMYRILYTIDDGLIIVCVVKVGHRREVYR